MEGKKEIDCPNDHKKREDLGKNGKAQKS